VGSIVDDRFGDMHLHQPNSWFHMLSDHAVVFAALPIAPNKTFVRTTWLVHADAVEGVDYDVPTLTHVWSATNAQDSAFVARTQRGVEDSGYQPGPYSEVEGDVEAFVNWYITRVRAHLSR
jgi:Rieske 2Fe-2S family protein